MTLQQLQNNNIDVLVLIDEFCKKLDLKYYLVGGSLLGACREKGFIPWDIDIDIAMPRMDFEKFYQEYSEHPSPRYQIDIRENGGELCVYDEEINVYSDEYNIDLMLKPHVDIYPIDNAPNNAVSRFLRWTYIDIMHLGISMSRIQECYSGNDRSFFKRIVIKICKKFHTEKVFKPEKYQKRWARAAQKNNSKPTNWIYIAYGVYGRKEFMPKIWIGSGTFLEFEGKLFPVYEQYKHYLSKIYGTDYMTPKKDIYR